MAAASKIVEIMERSSWIRRMFETGARLKAEHGPEKVCDFSLGNPNLAPPQAFTETVIELLREERGGEHGYMPNAGLADVRAKVAAFVSDEQDVTLDGAQIVMTCGAGGALNVALKTILNPGDEVLASTPCFMEYAFYVDNHGGKLELVSSRPDFDLDLDAIGSRITEKTAALIVNSPNNPTGRVYPEATVKQLGRLLSDKSVEMGRSIYLISDEPYRKIVYDGVEVPSVLAAYENSIIASSYSKDLSIPGERIGFLAVHPEADDLVHLVDGFILCNRILGFVNAPALMQRAVAALQGVAVDRRIYQAKRDRLCDGLASLGYAFSKPEGAFYLFPKSPTGDDLALVDVLREELILVVPGRGFGKPGYFRLAFCVEDDVLERSMAGFARAKEKLETS